ncbi:MAG: PIN domain-containing protein [Pseudomonadota bacterium]
MRWTRTTRRARSSQSLVLFPRGRSFTRRSCVNAAFFDSNIIVYSVDTRPESKDKKEQSRELVQMRLMTVSTQVLMETFNVLTKRDLTTRERATAVVEDLSNGIVVTVDSVDVLRALDFAERYQLSHWDGLILRAAEKARVDVVYTEDMKHGETYGSVRVCNPFIEDFLTT